MWVKNCIKEHFLSLIGGDSYHNALLMIKGCYPQQRWSDCVCTGGKPRLRLLAEQTRQQRNEGDAHQSDTAASHELLHALTLGRGVIVHGLFEVYGVQNLDLVAVLQHCVATFKHDSSFRVIRVKIENRSVTYNFRLRNYLLSHHHASAASSCPPRCPCSLR